MVFQGIEITDTSVDSSGRFSALYLENSTDLIRVLENTDLRYDIDGFVICILTDTPDETFNTIQEMVPAKRY